MTAFDWQRMLLDELPLAFLGEVAGLPTLRPSAMVAGPGQPARQLTACTGLSQASAAVRLGEPRAGCRLGQAGV
jgi:hypothetical protein